MILSITPTIQPDVFKTLVIQSYIMALWDSLIQPRSSTATGDVLEQAARVGAEQVGILHEDDAFDGIDTIIEKRSEVEATHGVCIDEQEPGDVKKSVKRYRSRPGIVAVAGRTVDAVKQATAMERVDIVIDPGQEGRGSGVDHVIASQAAENTVALGYTMKRLIEVSGMKRGFRLRDIREGTRLAAHYEAPVIVGSGASRKEQVRSPRDMAAVLAMQGFPDVAEKAVSAVPEQIQRHTAQIADPAQVRDGVTIE